MTTVWIIGRNELRVLLKSRTAYVWLFIMPLAFVYFMGMAQKGPGDPANRRPPVVVDNGDAGPLGAVFVDVLSAQGLYRVDPAKGETADRGIRIPSDFTQCLVARQPSKVAFFRMEGSNDRDAAIIEARLVRALVTMNGLLLEVGAAKGSRAEDLTVALEAARQKPDAVALEARFAGRRPRPTGFAFSLPGNLVMYVMMNLLVFGGATLAAGRRAGLARRVSVFPVSRSQHIGGVILGLVLLGLVQIGVLLAFGRFVLGVNLGANLPAVALVLVVFAWAAASTGVLIGSLLDTPERVAPVCVLSTLLLAALGGCWWPIEITPPTLRTIAEWLPTGWAVGALHRLISFGGDFPDVWRPLLKLTAFAAAMNTLAARVFRV